MEPYGIVYLLIDGTNDREYVGQTTKTFAERFSGHLYGDQYIDRVIRKCGAYMFATAILKVCYSQEELNYWEIHFIKSRDTMKPNGYNCTSGGEGGLLCEETKARISEAGKRRFEDPEERAKQAERTRKSFEDPERVAKHSESQKKRFEDPAERQKIADAVTERFSDPAERAAQAERISAYFDTPGAREKNGMAQKKRFEDPAEHEKVSVGLKKYYAEHGGRKQSDETRKKISVKRTAYWRRKRMEKLLPIIAQENSEAANLPATVSDGLKNFHAENPDAITRTYELRKQSSIARSEKHSKQSLAQKARRERERIAKMPEIIAKQNLAAANLPAEIDLSKIRP